jgi:hypothetical protein
MNCWSVQFPEDFHASTAITISATCPFPPAIFSHALRAATLATFLGYADQNSSKRSLSLQAKLLELEETSTKGIVSAGGWGMGDGELFSGLGVGLFS